VYIHKVLQIHIYIYIYIYIIATILNYLKISLHPEGPEAENEKCNSQNKK